MFRQIYNFFILANWIQICLIVNLSLYRMCKCSPEGLIDIRTKPTGDAHSLKCPSGVEDMDNRVSAAQCVPLLSPTLAVKLM